MFTHRRKARLKDVDREMMDLMDSAAVVYQLVFTKVDKTSQNELRHNITVTKGN